MPEDIGTAKPGKMTLYEHLTQELHAYSVFIACTEHTNLEHGCSDGVPNTGVIHP